MRPAGRHDTSQSGREILLANPNKQKGDRAERAARDYLQTIWPTIKTRAGFTDDLGDLICDTPNGRLVVQVKDVASPQWKQWFIQLADQVETCRRESDRPVIGGIILWKTRGSADPARWRVIAPLDHFTDIINQAPPSSGASLIQEES